MILPVKLSSACRFVTFLPSYTTVAVGHCHSSLYCMQETNHYDVYCCLRSSLAGCLECPDGFHCAALCLGSVYSCVHFHPINLLVGEGLGERSCHAV